MSRRRRTVAWTASAVVLAACCVGGTLVATGAAGPSSSADDAAADVTTSTGTVERGTLTGTTAQIGKLTRPPGPAIGGPVAGTLTEVPATGTVLHARDTLYRVDNAPVVFFDGELPQWRPFEAGMTKGPDVRQLEANLQAWGYLPVAADDVFDARTTRAIQAWQRDAGLERTGTVELGRLLFRTGELVVDAVEATPGSQVGGDTVYTTRRTERVVTVDLPAGSPLAVVGTVVQVRLPGGGTAASTVREVSAPRAKDDGGTVVTTTIAFDDPAAPGDLTDAGVTADFVSAVREDVLSVPVLALGAAAGGGFVVDVVQADGSVRQVPVETGLFAGDRVEVTGDVEAGDEVVVPEDS